jgi:hypothetical protein
MAQTLAQMVRAKYPGAYDDMSDADLESKVDAKYPGAYADIPHTQAAGAPPSMLQRAGSAVAGAASTVGNAVMGAVKGAGQTAQNVMASGAVDGLLGPGASMLARQNAPYAAAALMPEGKAQQVGHTAEQVGEYILPAAVTGGLSAGSGLARLAGRTAIEGGATAAVAQAQGSTPRDVGISALTGAAGPLVSKAAEAGAPLLRKMAETQYGRALNATTKPLKAESKRIVPELLNRGVTGNLEKLAETGAANASKAGKALDAAYSGATRAGVTTQTKPIMDALDKMKQRYYVSGPAGQRIAANPGAIEKVEALQSLIGQFGGSASPDQLWKFRKNMDDILAASGGFGVSLTPGTVKSIQREARTVVQKELNKAAPNIEQLNAEFSLWKGLEKVARATSERKIGQSGIVELGLRTSIGGAAGYLMGGNDREGAALGVLLGAITKHPQYRTMAASEKARLAHALAMGETATAISVATKALAGLENAGGLGRSATDTAAARP